MEWLLGAIVALAISGLSATLASRSARWSARLGAIGVVSACLVAAIPTAGWVMK